ncbi:MAG: hypothetical protein ACE5GJ_09100 [Gemmatimonadota bacterium]
MTEIDAVSSALMPYALAWMILVLGVRSAVVVRRGYRSDLAAPKGDPRRGILYSLTFAMLPWKKESTRIHPWTYAAGMGMHLGVLTTLIFAVGLRVGGWPAGALPLFGTLAAVGWVSAAGMMVKRLTRPYMRAITSPDDVLANVLVQLYLLGGALFAFRPGMLPLWRSAAVLLVIYLPLGKIYHMVLFFVSRVLFGLQFGRRGVLRHDVPLSY